MTAVEDEYLVAIELHSVERLKAVLDAGLDPQATVRGKSLTAWLTEMYTRSDAFADCLRLLLERGAVLDDPLIAPLLLDDVDQLTAALTADPSLLTHRTTLRSAFTPLDGATLHRALRRRPAVPGRTKSKPRAARDEIFAAWCGGTM